MNTTATPILFSDSLVQAVRNLWSSLAGDAGPISSTVEGVELCLDAGRLAQANPTANEEATALIAQHGFCEVSDALADVIGTF
jgi:hypothetical protein